MPSHTLAFSLIHTQTRPELAYMALLGALIQAEMIISRPFPTRYKSHRSLPGKIGSLRLELVLRTTAKDH